MLFNKNKCLLILFLLLVISSLVASKTMAKEPTTLVVALPGDIASLDVHQLFDPRAWPLARALYGGGFEWKLGTDHKSGLTSFTTDFQPGLIDSWDRREENGVLIYRLNLRKGCKFESGNELTAKDYVYRVARVNELSGFDNIVWGCTKGADCVKVIDDYTVEYHLDEPNAVSDRGMEELTMMIADSEELKKHHTDQDPWAHEFLRSNALGVGAYTLDHMTPGVEILLKKNETYCAPKNMHGYYDQILFKIIPSVSDQALLLRDGEIDLAPELPMKEVLDLLGKPGIEVLSFASLNLFYLGFNVSTEPFDNVKVRQALAYAMPSNDIIDAVFLGEAQKPAGLVTVGTVGATDKHWVYEFNLNKAKRLLAEAGYPDGFEMDLAFNLSRATHEDSAVLIKNSFAKIGVNVNLLKQNEAAFHEKLYAKQAPPAYLEEVLAWTNDAGYTYDMEYSPWGFANFGNWLHPKMEKLIKEAWLVRDPDVRLPMYDEVQKIVDTELPVIAIAQPNYVVALRNDIKGYVKTWDELPRYHMLSPSK